MSLAAVQLRDAIRALETARNTFAIAIRTCETSGLDPGIAVEAQLHAEAARACSTSAICRAQQALQSLGELDRAGG